jgi:3-deoxy-D-manno-octulosonic-acid transferase
MILLYNLLIRLYVLMIGIAGIWNKKAREWKQGRKDWREKLELQISAGDRIIWIHCASAGEFEQGKPIIGQLKEIYPAHKILVSFFSPSGFQAAKKYPHADIISYLPADTKKNAAAFFQLVKPELVVFVKYEYWFHHLSTIAFHHTPLLLVSAIFRKEQLFFKWYGKFFRRMLFLFRHIFVQDEDSLQLLRSINIQHSSISGDTRFDRVKKIADQFTEVKLVNEFAGEQNVIVAGSTWPEDEKILADFIKNHDARLIVAPHEINPAHINSIQNLFPDHILYSEISPIASDAIRKNEKTSVWDSIRDQEYADLQKKLTQSKTLIIDTMGILSKLYHYGTITYVGGGFGRGIHNTLEAAVYGKPVFFGPNYQKFKEAKDLIKKGGAFTISDAESFKVKAEHLLHEKSVLQHAAMMSKKYVEENTGAAQKVIEFIQENRLLTN